VTSASNFWMRAVAVAGVVAVPTAAFASEDKVNARELLLQAINLVIVLGVLFYFARKPILEYFATRRSDIKRDLETSADLLTAAEHRNSQIQRKLVDLESQLVEIVEASRRRADDESERILAEARKTADRIHDDAKIAAEQEFVRARRTLRAEAAELAVELASEILRESVSQGDRDRLIDEFITRVESGRGATA
jgi:F-type H+-transporting ATPase subunit b